MKIKKSFQANVHGILRRESLWAAIEDRKEEAMQEENPSVDWELENQYLKYREARDSVWELDNIFIV